MRWHAATCKGLLLAVTASYACAVNYCGSTYSDSTTCHQVCPGGMDGECPTGEFCYAHVPCDVAPPGECEAGLAMSVKFGYYGSWASSRSCSAVGPSDLNAAAYTHLAFSFAAVSSSFKLIAYEKGDDALYKKFNALKKANPSLRTSIAVGGWSFNDPPTQYRFSKMVATARRRSIFIQSALAFMRKYDFDGLDLDWEYPGAKDRGGSAADFRNYGLLLGEIHRAFDRALEDFQVTMAVPASNWFLKGFDLPTLAASVDFFNVMTYDLTPDGDFVGSHTDLRLIKETLNIFWKNKVPASKVVLGLAAYGHSWTLADASCSTPGCKFSGSGTAGRCTAEEGTLGYFEIMDLISAGDSDSPVLDENSGSMYVVINGDQWVSYDNAETFSIKRSYANELCLRGTMVWSVDMILDDFAPLGYRV